MIGIGLGVVGQGGGRRFSPGQLSAVKFWLDAGTISGVSDGSNIATSNWVDQSQAQKGALGTATNCVYRTDGGNGRPAVEFNGTNSVAKSQTLSIPATGRRVFLVAKDLMPLTSGFSRKYLLDGGALDQGSIITGGTSNIYGQFNSNTLSVPASTWNGIEQGVTYLLDLVTNGASSSLQVSGQVIKAGNFAAAVTYTALTLGAPGNLTGGFYTNCQIQEVIVCDSTLTVTQANQIIAYLRSKYSILTKKFLICDGNSLTFGFGSTGSANGWPVQIASLLSGGANAWRILNNGVSGQTTPQMETQAAQAATALNNTDQYLGNYVKTIVTGWEAVNDIVSNGVDGPTAYSTLVTFFNNRRAANAAAKLVVFTCLPATSYTGTQNTAIAYVNSSILANWAGFADGVVDVNTDPRLANPANTTYFADGKHLTDAGYGVLAGIIAPTINALAA